MKKDPTQNLPSPKVQFSEKSEFFKTLSDRVNAAIPQDTQRDVGRSYLKITQLTALYFLNLYALMNPGRFLSNMGFDVTELSPWIVLIFFSTQGLLITLLGFNVFHDSIHESLSKNRKVNRFFGFLSCSLIGASRYLWLYKHNILHHQYPNIKGLDDDLETRNNLRFSSAQPWHKKFTYQHLYCPFIYALTTLEWIMVKDYRQYFSMRINPYKLIPKMTTLDHMEFWASKLIYISLLIVLPLTVMDPVIFLVGFVIMHVSTSLPLAAIFQLAHISEGLEFPEPEKPLASKHESFAVETAENQNDVNTIKTDWAELQMKTTVDFATASPMVNWISGGLNFQVEHHLFPRINNIHYPAIHEILKKTAKEFKMPLHCQKTYWGALKAHFMMLKEFGQPDVAHVTQTKPATQN